MRTESNGVSIQSKLIFFSLSISLIPIAVITAIYYFNASSILRKHTLSNLTVIAEAKKRHILSFVESKKERTIDFSSDGYIRDAIETITHGGSDSRDAGFALNSYLLLNKKPLDCYLLEITVVEDNGKVVASTNERLVGKDLSSHVDVLKDIDKAYVCVNQPHPCPCCNTYCLSVYVPLFDSRTREKAFGAIINCYDLTPLSKITTIHTGMGVTEEVYLVNKNKIMLTESRLVKDALLRQVVDTEPVCKIIEEGREMAGIYHDYRGMPVVGASSYIPEYGWILLAEIDKAEAFEPLKTLSITALTTSLVVAFIVSSGGIVFALSTARPIHVLKSAADKFRAGELDYRVKIDRRDEIGELANSFNAMADVLVMETHKLSCAVEQSPCPVVITDINGLIEYVNPRFTQLTGYASQEVIGKNSSILKSDKTPPEEYKVLWNTITSGREWRGEFCNKKKNGDLYWVSASISPVRKKGGIIANFVGIQQDITEHKHVEEYLKVIAEQRDRYIKNMEHLMYFSTVMNDEIHEGELLNHMASILKEHFRLDIVAVLIVDRAKRVLSVPVILPPMPVKNIIREEVLLEPSLCRVIRTGQEIISKDVTKELFCECLNYEIREGGCMCFPMMAGGITVGIVLMIKKGISPWHKEETYGLLSTYTGLASSALYRVRLMEFTKRTSITDALTGLYNRRFFDEMIEKQVALAKRHNEPLCLIIADIDHFKDLNDTYGHVAGDSILQSVSKVIKDSIRSADILARYGGEEFAIIMPTTDMASAVEKGEGLRHHVESINFDNIVPGQSIRLTISLGVASLPEHGAEANTLVNAADSALYKAKKGGRNRIEVP